VITIYNERYIWRNKTRYEYSFSQHKIGMQFSCVYVLDCFHVEVHVVNDIEATTRAQFYFFFLQARVYSVDIY
jgi:hypothetical protein